VRTFVIESYLSRDYPEELEAASRRLRASVEARTPGGDPIRYLRSVFVPDDEVCFHFVEAPSEEVVATIVARAAISPERIVEARTSEPPRRAGGSGRRR
jgi:hypothetical protein